MEMILTPESMLPKSNVLKYLNGASSALYGTNAIGGVINIITDDAKKCYQCFQRYPLCQ